MASYGSKAGGGGAAIQAQSGGAPQLDSDLIRRANSAGIMVDYGDAGVRQYNRHIDEINAMDLTPQEREQAISQLHSLMTAQLEAESKSFGPYSYGVGPARFDRNKMMQNENKAANARQEVRSFMNGLQDAQKKKVREREQKALSDAAKKALDSGALEFTVNGTTWRRKTRRSKSFTAE